MLLIESKRRADLGPVTSTPLANMASIACGLREGVSHVLRKPAGQPTRLLTATLISVAPRQHTWPVPSNPLSILSEAAFLPTSTSTLRLRHRVKCMNAGDRHEGQAKT